MGKKSKASLNAETLQHLEQQVLERVEAVLPDTFYLLAVHLEKELGQWYLRLFLEGRGFRIALSDCETISRQVDTLIEEYWESQPEVKDLSYCLEVSSPGLFRPITTLREAEFYLGQPIKVICPAKTGKKKQTYAGVLTRVDSVHQAIVLEAGDGREAVTFPLNDETISITLNPTVAALEDSLLFPEPTVLQPLPTDVLPTLDNCFPQLNNQGEKIHD